MSDPKPVLAEYGLDVPDGMDVKVVENSDNCVHITLSGAPENLMELSDEELSNAAAGDVRGGVAVKRQESPFISLC